MGLSHGHKIFFWYLPYKILSGYLWILILFLWWQGGGHGHGQHDVGAPHDSGHCWLHNMSNIPPLTDMQAMQGWIISPELFTHCFYHKDRVFHKWEVGGDMGGTHFPTIWFREIFKTAKSGTLSLTHLTPNPYQKKGHVWKQCPYSP